MNLCSFFVTWVSGIEGQHSVNTAAMAARESDQHSATMI
jgi:hypothetical protein